MQLDINLILSIFMAVTSGGMLLWSFIGNRVRGIQTVDTISAMQMINHKNALVLDVREEKEYQAGHVLNAKWIPVGKLKDRLADLEKFKDRPIIIVCHSGARAGDASSLLGKNGFAQAYALTGGMSAWQKANLPLEK